MFVFFNEIKIKFKKHGNYICCKFGYRNFMRKWDYSMNFRQWNAEIDTISKLQMHKWMKWKKVAWQLIVATNVIQFSKKKKKNYPNNCYGLIYSVSSPLPQMVGPGSVIENYRKEN